MEATVRTFFIDDAGTNKIIAAYTDKRITVYLQLQAEQNRKRKVGVVTKSTQTLFVRRVRAQHLFRKGNSYGFNDYVLRNQTTFKFINLFDGLENWKIPVEFILSQGQYLNFLQQGYEKQIFVSLTQIEPYKVKPSEKRRF